MVAPADAGRFPDIQGLCGGGRAFGDASLSFQPRPTISRSWLSVNSVMGAPP